MTRVAGADPGTSSLDLLVLVDGAVSDQVRFTPEQLAADVLAPVRWLRERGPLDLVAGPSGYGLPLVRAADCTDRDLDLISLVRPDERGHGGGVRGFSALVRSLRDSGLPVVFLPGVIHMPTVAPWRKINRIDLGTADKLCVAALALEREPDLAEGRICVVELGSAFTACVALEDGRVVDGVGGTGGPVGWTSGGGWDGEVAYFLSPLAKRDLFAGGADGIGDMELAGPWFRESLVKAVAGLQAVAPFDRVVVSGRLLEVSPDLGRAVLEDLVRFGSVRRLGALPGAWVKHAAQGAAVIADGLAGGRSTDVVRRLELHRAAGTVLDWLCYPRAAEVREAFGL
jgi:predicted butyrate kinase (DUF1464 family)